MKIKMNEIESNQFNRMFEQHEKMYNMLTDLQEAIIGKPEYKQKGLIDEVRELRETVRTHDISDTERFNKIFEYQKKQQLFVGWTSIMFKALWAIALVALGYFIPKFFEF